MKRVEQRLEIPKEHVGRVMNSLICENMLGFERQLNASGKFEWRGKSVGNDEWTEWTESLEEILDFNGQLDEAMDLMQQVCQDNNIGYNVVFDPRRRVLTVFLLAVGEGGKPVPRIQIEGTALSSMVCAAICGLNNWNIAEHHKTLYPANYLLLNS